MDPTEGEIVVTNEAESSLVCEVKENKDQYHIFLYLKENVHKQRVSSFEQGGDGVAKIPR